MSNINTNLNIKTRVRLYVLYDIIKNSRIFLSAAR